jgi:hypothetical protein
MMLLSPPAQFGDGASSVCCDTCRARAHGAAVRANGEQCPACLRCRLLGKLISCPRAIKTLVRCHPSCDQRESNAESAPLVSSRMNYVVHMYCTCINQNARCRFRPGSDLAPANHQATTE